MLLYHQFSGNAVRGQELDTRRRAKVVVDRVAQVKVRVEVGPTEGDGDFEFRHRK